MVYKNRFKLLYKKNLDEIRSKGYVYKHNCGITLVFIKNKDINNVFSISFKTPAFNSKGIPHILEHCLITKSKKYPVKDAFNELCKKKIHTYLNAITFNDKTIYPLASYSKKDFFKMVDVYLDGVLNPLIFNKKEIFLQEGFRYELDENNNLKYNGVVYNEMIGTYTNKEYYIKRIIYKYLFPDTQYKYDCAGDPKYIKEVTFDDIISYYKKYYTYSNSVIYLYGDKIDIKKYLDYISENYLNNNFINNKKIYIKLQEKFNRPIIKKIYSNLDSDYLCAAFVVNSLNNSIINDYLKILIYYFFESNKSPLKNYLYSIYKEIIYNFDTDLVQPVFYIFVKKNNNDKDNIISFKNLLFSFFNDIIKNGIDKDYIISSINKYEFDIKEKNYGYKPEGLIYNIKIIENFIANKNLLDGFNNISNINKIKNIKEEEFINIIKQIFINNNHSLFIYLKSSNNIKLKNLINNKEYNLDNEIIKLIKKDMNLLKKFISYNDSKISYKLIKCSKIKKLLKKNLYTNFKVENIKSVSIYTNNKEIIYISIYFNISNIDNKIYKFIGLYILLLGKLPIKTYQEKDLYNIIEKKFLNLKLDYNYYYSNYECKYKNFLEIKIKTTYDKIYNICDIISKIIIDTKFEDKEKILYLLKEYRDNIRNNIIYRDINYAEILSQKYFSQGSYIYDLVKGNEFINYINYLIENFDKEKYLLEKNLNSIKKYIFTKENFNIFVSCNINNKLEKIKLDNIYKKIYNSLYNKKSIKIIDLYNKYNNPISSYNNLNIGISLSCSFKEKGYVYTPIMKVLESIINNYLYEELRKNGGAYQSYVKFKRDGLITFTSYKDININRSLDIFLNSYKSIINKTKLDKKNIQNYIINCINILTKPKNNYEKYNFIIYNYFSDISRKDLIKERKKIFNTNTSDIIFLLDVLKYSLENYKIYKI